MQLFLNIHERPFVSGALQNVQIHDNFVFATIYVSAQILCLPQSAGLLETKLDKF